MPGIHAQYAELQPTFNQIDRLQELVETAQRDTDAIGKQQIHIIHNFFSYLPFTGINNTTHNLICFILEIEKKSVRIFQK